MYRRDELLKNSMSLSENAERAYQAAEQQCKQIMAAAKEAVHSARIRVNQMKREAELIQEAINEEMELQVKEQQAAENAWEVKSKAHLKAELEADDNLVELIKKVN